MTPDDDAALTVADEQEITRVLSLHGHLFDDGELDSLDAVFTADVEYDTSPMSGPVMHGIAEILQATYALGEANPVAHLVTNVVINPTDADTALVRSKGLGIAADGTVGSVTYHDVVLRTPHGWRLRHRVVHPRRRPLTFG